MIVVHLVWKGEIGMKLRRLINLFVIIVLCGCGGVLFQTSVSEASVKNM
jgi:hypothetical protein